ncbi:CDP-glycerol glycerophosphotransferase family protein [Erwinia oleae]|uniref:CDP-glycerol glycerophosphotransferase family protein n=1 Tax=Erwinia oleae TaxID=796334 RepID=UPI00054D463F|nr:CDP-glycerol glycerophosphotransferase family protein [Erwinia oleae]
MSERPLIGFYMETAFHYDVYKNIILALQASGHACALVISDVIEASFVKEMVEKVKTLRHPDLPVFTLSKLVSERVVLPCMVSPYYTPLLKGRARHHVRALYGLAKDRWGHAWWNTFYDLILCYGDHTQEKLNIAGTAVTVGNPRFDDWHNLRYDRSLVQALGRNRKKPVVLYAPTFGELCSVPHWAEQLNALQSRCTLLIRLHHGTRLRPSEAASRALVDRYFRKNIVSGAGAFPLLEAADMVLTDNSGFLFDAIHAGKRTVLLEWPGLKALLESDRTLSDLHSAEQQARKKIETAGSLKTLQTLLENQSSYRVPDELTVFRQRYCDKFQDGKAGGRAATAIADLLTRPTPVNFYLHSLREQLFNTRA